MCQSAVFVKKQDGSKELVLDEVIMIRPDGDELELMNIVGDRKRLRARIDHIDLLKHQVVLEEQAGDRV